MKALSDISDALAARNALYYSDEQCEQRARFKDEYTQELIYMSCHNCAYSIICDPEKKDIYDWSAYLKQPICWCLCEEEMQPNPFYVFGRAGKDDPDCGWEWNGKDYE